MLLCTVLVFAGCRKATQTSNPTGSKLDACILITKDEISALQGSAVTEAKSSAQANGGFRVAQCFYTATEFSKSVVLSVTQRDPENPGERTPGDFWNDTFRKDPDADKEREAEREEGEKVEPPKKIHGVGDEAYWTGMRFGGALYVLKKDAFIRISVGGGNDEENRINRSKALALKALGRL